MSKKNIITTAISGLAVASISIYLNKDAAYEMYLQNNVNPNLLVANSQVSYCGETAFENESPEQLISRISSSYIKGNIADLIGKWDYKLDKEAESASPRIIEIEKIIDQWGSTYDTMEELEYAAKNYTWNDDYKSQLEFRKKNTDLDIEALKDKRYELMTEYRKTRYDEALASINSEIDKGSCILGEETFKIVKQAVPVIFPKEELPSEEKDRIIKSMNESFMSEQNSEVIKQDLTKITRELGKAVLGDTASIRVDKDSNEGNSLVHLSIFSINTAFGIRNIEVKCDAMPSGLDLDTGIINKCKFTDIKTDKGETLFFFDVQDSLLQNNITTSLVANDHEAWNILVEDAIRRVN